MMHVVRRPQLAFSSQPVFNVDRAIPFISRKARMLEFAFVSLAATNLFIVTSAVAFYWFANKH
jgi:hypothetical protein